MTFDPDGNFVDKSKEVTQEICEHLELPFKWPDSKFGWMQCRIQSLCFLIRERTEKRAKADTWVHVFQGIEEPCGCEEHRKLRKIMEQVAAEARLEGWADGQGEAIDHLYHPKDESCNCAFCEFRRETKPTCSTCGGTGRVGVLSRRQCPVCDPRLAGEKP